MRTQARAQACSRQATSVGHDMHALSRPASTRPRQGVNISYDNCEAAAADEKDSRASCCLFTRCAGEGTVGRACARANGHARRVDAFGGQLGKAVVRPYVRRRRSEDREAPQAATRESDGQRAWPPPLQQLQHASTGWGVHARPRRRLTRATLGLEDKRSSRIAQARLHSRARVTTVHTHADCTSLTISDRLTLNFSLYLTAKPHFRPTDICHPTLCTNPFFAIFASKIP